MVIISTGLADCYAVNDNFLNIRVKSTVSNNSTCCILMLCPTSPPFCQLIRMEVSESSMTAASKQRIWHSVMWHRRCCLHTEMNQARQVVVLRFSYESKCHAPTTCCCRVAFHVDIVSRTVGHCCRLTTAFFQELLADTFRVLYEAWS